MSYREIKVFGPPGTGKTTYACRQIERAAREFGPDRILVTSFTRTAAIEIGARAKLEAREACATLHAHALRAIGGGKVAETLADEFNAYVTERGLSHYRLTGKVDTDADTFETAASEAAVTGDVGTKHYLTAQHHRARMIPPADWPDADAAAWFATWQAWKASRDEDTVDFTDMVELAVARHVSPPRRCDIIFADEAQDFTLLELALLRQWGRMAGTLVLLGDDDQCIYTFKGASHAAFLDSPPDATVEKIQLRQSYRVPSAIHAHAARWVDPLQRREVKDWHPRDEAGAVTRVSATLRMGDAVAQIAERYAATGTVMVLATCSYMLEPVIAAMRASGLPYHNPYRAVNGRWNPLPRRSGAVTAAERIATFMLGDGRWTLAMLWAWCAHVRGQKSSDDDEGVLLYRKRAALERAAKERPDEDAVLADWLTPWACDDCQYGEVDWFRNALKPDEAARYTYPLAVVDRRGIDAALDMPRIIVGTIHSVKGGEADTVIVSPDASRNGVAEMRTADGADTMRRLFYVAVTRARGRVIMLSPSSSEHVMGLMG